jgi:hypothetical protein
MAPFWASTAPDIPYDFNADPAFHHNGDPDLYPASQNNADPYGSGFATLLIRRIQNTWLDPYLDHYQAEI